MKSTEGRAKTAFYAQSFDGKLLLTTCVFLMLAAGLYGLSWNAVTAGFLSDDAVYLLMADSFGANAKENPELAGYVMRQSLFPPLYPLLLAAFGAGSSDVLRAHLVTTTTFVIALGIFGAWIYSQTRDRIASILLVLAFALLPGVLLQNLETLSDFPFLLFSLLALWLADRPPVARWGRLPVAICVGLAALTRSGGGALILAFAVWLSRQRREGRVACFALAVLPSLIWILVKRGVYGSHTGYSQIWSELFRATGAQIPSFLVQQCVGLWGALLADMDFWQSGLTHVAAAWTLSAALWMWASRLREWRLDAWYFLVGVAMLLVWPFPDYFPRLILPWVPILVFYAYFGITGIGARWGDLQASLAGFGYVAVMLMAIAPSLIFIDGRLREPVASDMTHWKHTRYWLRPSPGDLAAARADVAHRQSLIKALRQTEQLVDKGACIFGVHTAIGMLYAHRVFVQPPPPSADSTEFERRILDCPYALLTSVVGVIGSDRVSAFYPYDRLPNDVRTVQVWVDSGDPQAPVAVLVRLSPPPAERTAAPMPVL